MREELFHHPSTMSWWNDMAWVLSFALCDFLERHFVIFIWQHPYQMMHAEQQLIAISLNYWIIGQGIKIGRKFSHGFQSWVASIETNACRSLLQVSQAFLNIERQTCLERYFKYLLPFFTDTQKTWETIHQIEIVAEFVTPSRRRGQHG